ncbi:MAG: methionyl-tRNA formyltransferase, partial [Rhodospirillales bacterium]
NPRPGVWFEHDGNRIKVLAAEVTNEAGRSEEAGTVVDGTLSVTCGEGALRLLRLQRAGKATQAATEFLHGYTIEKGRRLI